MQEFFCFLADLDSGSKVGPEPEGLVMHETTLSPDPASLKLEQMKSLAMASKDKQGNSFIGFPLFLKNNSGGHIQVISYLFSFKKNTDFGIMFCS